MEGVQWSDPMSPSFRNIVKNVLIHQGLLTATDKVDTMRKVLEQHKIPQPGDWFLNTRAQGVLWLNTSLTFSSTDKVPPAVADEEGRAAAAAVESSRSDQRSLWLGLDVWYVCGA